jgi:acyl carrier protein
MSRVQGKRRSMVNTQREQARPTDSRERGDSISFEHFVGTVARFVAERTGVNANRIHPDFDFINAGLLDSISTIELFFFIRDEFDEGFLSGEIDVAEMNTPAKLYRRYLDTKSRRQGSE